MSQIPIAEKELTFERVFDARIDLVWEVWTQAEHVKEWFGPDMFSIPVCTWDAKPGGELLIHMQGPDGGVHTMNGIFIEAVKPSKLTFSMTIPGPDGVKVMDGTTTVSFSERGDKTQMSLTTMGIGYAEVAKFMLEGMEPGWTQTLAKLAARIEALR